MRSTSPARLPPADMAERQTAAQGSGISRRRLLAGGAAAAGAAGAAWTAAAALHSGDGDGGFGRETVPFYGRHQAGIDTRPQAHGLFVALDLIPDSRRSADQILQAVLKLWTADAQRLTQGAPALADTEPELALRPARLTLTVGFGPTLFDRVGLGDRRPTSARELPVMAIDRLDPSWCGGDLLLQICSDDPLVVSHAARVLLKNVRTLATERWRQAGFRTARGADGDGATMRNLMGQVDGTVNPAPGTQDFDDSVWDSGQSQPWLAGGTLMVIRRIGMSLDTWDQLDRQSKELTIGRRLDNGAPLNGKHETDPVDLSVKRDGIAVIPPNSHVALAHRQQPDERFLRRAYNFDDPPGRDQTTNSGLIFVAFQRDIDRQFLPVQRRLAEFDALNRWTTPIGSAVFVIPPGIPPGGYIGQQLLAGSASPAPPSTAGRESAG